jgi:hypothetical protein
LQSILYRHQPESNPYYNSNLYIRGVVNQEIQGVTEDSLPADQKAPNQVAKIRKGAHLNPKLDPANPVHPVALITGGVEPPLRLDEDVQVPANIKAKFHNWVPELLGASQVMIHSKCVVIDPFGEHPVVITGSHNLGPKASGKNDDNMVIIEGNAALAQAYAVNIISIFQQYRYRHYVGEHTAPNAWHGLEDNDTWQQGHLTGDAEAEMQFWLGKTPASAGGSIQTPQKAVSATASASDTPSAATPAKAATAGAGTARHQPVPHETHLQNEHKASQKAHFQSHHNPKGKKE